MATDLQTFVFGAGGALLVLAFAINYFNEPKYSFCPLAWAVARTGSDHRK